MMTVGPKHPAALTNALLVLAGVLHIQPVEHLADLQDFLQFRVSRSMNESLAGLGIAATVGRPERLVQRCERPGGIAAATF